LHLSILSNAVPFRYVSIFSLPHPFFSSGLFYFRVAYYSILKLKGHYCGVMGWIHVSESFHFAGRDVNSGSIKVDGFI
jgi:hypothetical protein